MRGFFLSVFFKIWSVEGSSFEKAPPTTLLLPSIYTTYYKFSYIISQQNCAARGERWVSLLVVERGFVIVGSLIVASEPSQDTYIPFEFIV